MTDTKGSKRGGNTKFKKGHNRPGPGRPKIPVDVIEARKFSAHEVEILFTKFIQMTREQLSAVKNNPQATLLELTLHSIFTHAINHGDHVRLDFVLNRLIGKSREKIEMNLESKEGTMSPRSHISEMIKNPELVDDLIKLEQKFRSLSKSSE